MTLKRILAYIIDFIIVVFLSSLLGTVLPNSAKLNEKSLESTTLLEEYYEKLSENDVEGIEEYDEKINDLVYDVSKLSVYTTLVSALLYFLYFIVFQSYNNGQTLGKRLLKIEVVSVDNKEPTFIQMLIRGFILYPIVFKLLDVGLVLLLNKNMYLSISQFMTYLHWIVFIACFVSLMIKGRGIHDLFAKTMVVEQGASPELEEGNATKWQENSSHEKEVKKYKDKHTTGKRKG